MYPINLLESSGRIRKLVSQSKAGIMPLKQNHIPQDEQSYNTIVTCKWALRQVVDFRLEISSLNLTNTLPFKNFTAKEMNNLVIKNMKVVPCVGSKFVQMARVLFNQNGIDRAWDYIKVHDSVAALLLNKTRNTFVLVKQFRPAVYMHRNRTLNEQKNGDKAEGVQVDSSIQIKAPISDGVTYELCAGIVDKDIALNLIMKQEVLEECGYDVPEEKFEKIFSSRGSVGIAGSVQYVFYAEVTDDMIVSEGGGNKSEGEHIEVYYLPMSNVKEFLFNETLPKPPSLMAAFFWYLNTKGQEK